MHPVGALSLMILEDGPLFVADTHVHPEPSPEQMAETVDRLGPARPPLRAGAQVALCSQRSSATSTSTSARRMREALAILDGAPRDFAYEGEMHADSALDPGPARRASSPRIRFQGAANVLVFANSDAASGVRNILKMKATGSRSGRS